MLSDGQSSWCPKRLSEAAAVVWGKSQRDSDAFLPLWRHLADAAPVAGKLWDHWVPDRVRRLITEAMPGGDADARRLVVWLAGIHDIGKATPTFTKQVPALAAQGEIFGLDWSTFETAHHTVTGQLIFERWLKQNHGWKPRKTRQLSTVVGGHHGKVPEPGLRRDVADHPRSMGWLNGDDVDSSWAKVQRELLDWAADSAGVTERLPEWQNLQLPQPVSVLLTAIVIVADWIASNENYFPLDTPETDTGRIETGWAKAELPPRWKPHDVPRTVDDLFMLRFGFDAPYPVQRKAVELARTAEAPSLFIIEAAMGEGKTEAALGMAEILAELHEDNGVVIALPTRATSDGMLSRITSWLKRLPRKENVTFDVGLGHGKKHHNQQYRDLRDAGPTVDAHADGEEGYERKKHVPDVAAHRWFAGAKRTLLSQFVVATIDQVLFAALKAKHVVMRHLGFAGKVVIIDEAHAYDVYMSQYLERAIEWLSAYGCTVIVLSATLPGHRRKALVEAFQSTNDIDNSALEGDIGYPTIVVAPRDATPSVQQAEQASRACDVSIEYLDDDNARLGTELREALSDGGCALVIRNTVRRAQDTAAYLREEFGSSIGVRLNHSRFIAPDRARDDLALLRDFGRERPDSVPAQVVVATQVAEQSLDLDFDLLVTDLAPMDLMLQRMGRMHRHQRGEAQSGRPPRLREARCLITGADWSTTPPEPVGGSQRVYGQYPLLCAAAVVDTVTSGSGVINLPRDIAPLVQKAYGEELSAPEGWEETWNKARDRFHALKDRKEYAAKTYRLDKVQKDGEGLSTFALGDAGDIADKAEGRAQVRDGADSLEVILLVNKNGALFMPDWLGRYVNTEIPKGAEPESNLARVVSQCTIALPSWIAGEKFIDALEDRHDLDAWQASHWLQGELVLDIDADTHVANVGGYRFHYDQNDGLTVAKTEGAGAGGPRPPLRPVMRAAAPDGPI